MGGLGPGPLEPPLKSGPANNSRMRAMAAFSRSSVDGQNQKVVKCDFGDFRSSGQHADGFDRLGRYDFLLVYYSDLRSRWNRFQRESRNATIPNNRSI